MALGQLFHRRLGRHGGCAGHSVPRDAAPRRVDRARGAGDAGRKTRRWRDRQRPGLDAGGREPGRQRLDDGRGPDRAGHHRVRRQLRDHRQRDDLDAVPAGAASAGGARPARRAERRLRGRAAQRGHAGARAAAGGGGQGVDADPAAGSLHDPGGASAPDADRPLRDAAGGPRVPVALCDAPPARAVSEPRALRAAALVRPQARALRVPAVQRRAAPVPRLQLRDAGAQAFDRDDPPALPDLAAARHPDRSHRAGHHEPEAGPAGRTASARPALRGGPGARERARDGGALTSPEELAAVTAFPPSPVPPSRFFSDFLPKAFAEAGLPPGSENLGLKLGIELTGPGGGQWVFEVEGGTLRVREAPRDATAFTVRQSVADWRGALWEGRGGPVARQAMAIFRPGEPPTPGPAGLAGPPGPAALALLGGARGSLRLVVAGGPGGDWQVEFKLGPGEIPEAPTTTVTIQAEDADRMERGELNPMEAFMAGRIQVAGDMALLMQLQAAQMQASLAAAAAGAGGAPK